MIIPHSESVGIGGAHSAGRGFLVGCVQAPDTQTSSVQLLPSLAHAVPSGLGVVKHPLAASQPGVAHSPAVQLIGENTQPMAALHVSIVHAFSSLHVIGVCTHPVAGLQLSVVHAFWSSHEIGVNTHPVAALHVSVVHALLSLHVIGVCTHPVAGLQVSVVHAF